MPKKRHPFAVLRHRDFRLMWMSIFISRIGAEMQLVAVNWQIYTLTHSPLSLGIIGLARFIPVILASPLSGVASDRYSRTKIMLTAQVSLMIISLIMAVTTLTGHMTPLLVYLCIGLAALMYSFDTPSRQSVYPFLVPRDEFMQAISLNNIMFQSAMILGPSLAGFAIAYLGLGWIYAITALCFIAVIATLLTIPPFRAAGDRTTPFLTSFLNGLRYVKRSPLIWSTMLLDFFATFFGSAMTLMPIFAKDIFNVGPQGLGLLYAAPSVGAVTAGLVFSSIGTVGRQGIILVTSVVVYGAATVLFGLSRIFPLSLFFLFFVGAGDMVSSIIRNTMRQLTTPDHVRGRMVSINMIFYLGGPQLGEVESGVLATLVGTPMTVTIGGIATVAATLILSRIVPKLRKYDKHVEAV